MRTLQIHRRSLPAARDRSTAVQQIPWRSVGAEYGATFTLARVGTTLAEGGFNAALRDLGRLGQIYLDHVGLDTLNRLLPPHSPDRILYRSSRRARKEARPLGANIRQAERIAFRA